MNTFFIDRPGGMKLAFIPLCDLRSLFLKHLRRSIAKRLKKMDESDNKMSYSKYNRAKRNCIFLKGFEKCV